MKPIQIMTIAALSLVVSLGAACGPSQAPSRDESPASVDLGSPVARPATGAWDRTLREHAVDGGLDYAALAGDRSGLDEYLESIREFDPESIPVPDRIAFWINAYNAAVAALVLDRYPGIESVRTVDGFFDELTVRVAGEERTLDEIEAQSRELGDARVHFAVVCASTSCPDLLAEAYTGPELERQLQEQTRRFLADESKGLRFDRAENTLWLSSIFKWYAGDFTGGSTVVAFFKRGGVLAWVLERLEPGLAESIADADPSVRYLDYDWSLNDR